MMPLLLTSGAAAEVVVIAATDEGEEVNDTPEDEEVNGRGLPTALAGMADPTPVLVKGVGRTKLEVLGSAIVSP